MRPVSSPTARLTGVLLTTVLAATFLVPSSASAATPQAPGDITGHAFDTCVAPSQTVMDAWNLESPYSVIGIYTSGSSRYCGDKYQPHLSKAWVQKNADRGWRFLPIHVGYQAPCFVTRSGSRVQKKRMSSTIATARKQGAADAAEAIAALEKYGFGAGSAAYLDIEHYPRTKACDDAVLEFTDAWTETLHDAGYRSGLYSSGSAAIKAIDDARVAKRKGLDLPDHLWLAWGNKKADTAGGPYLRDDGWVDQRIHQYHLDVKQTFGGHALTIDKNVIDVGKGSVATKESLPCGVGLTLASYPRLTKGSSGAAVSALQCLLNRQGLAVTVTGTFDTATARGIDAWRKRLGWGPTGRTTVPTWTSLLAAGSTPRVLKEGSTGEAVWRLQRALRAAGTTISVTGVYDPRTVVAVQAYRKAHGLKVLTTTEASVWALVQRGKPLA